MSVWCLCSAWSDLLWLQSDSLLGEFNLHHTPHQSSLPFYQSIFGDITPTDLFQSGQKCTSAFKLYDGLQWWTLCLCYFVSKAKYNFQFFMIRCSVYCGSAQLQRRADTVSELLNPLESWFWPVCQPSQRYPSTLSVRVCVSQRRGCVREMHHRNWTWNAISLLATKVQVDWGLSWQIFISCLGIGEHGLSSLLEMMLSPTSWQLKSVHLDSLQFHYGDIWGREGFLTNPIVHYAHSPSLHSLIPS